MLLADTYLGNVEEDAALADRVESDGALTVAVDETERRRSRFRTTTEDGTEVGVVVGRELRAGDVLSADGTLVVVSLESVPAMVVDLSGVEATAPTVRTALELGHAVGNRHWDLALDGECAYFPLADSRDRMEAEVEPHLPEGASVDYDDVTPTLFDDGGHGTDGHSHSHGGHDHTHTHGGHDHSHDTRELDTEESP